MSFGSNIKVWWLLIFTDSKTNKTFHFEWERQICEQVKNNTCPYLLNQKIMIGFNDLITTHPDIAKQWHPTKNNGLYAHDFTAISEKKVWWLLPYDDPRTGNHFNFEWQDTISYRAKNKNCPYLTGHKVYQGFNDLVTTHPDIANNGIQLKIMVYLHMILLQAQALKFGGYYHMMIHKLESILILNGNQQLKIEHLNQIVHIY